MESEGPTFNETFMDSKDFSLTSLISDLSQRLGSNNSLSPSVLVVDEEGTKDDGRFGELLSGTSVAGLDECHSVPSFALSNYVEEVSEINQDASAASSSLGPHIPKSKPVHCESTFKRSQSLRLTTNTATATLESLRLKTNPSSKEKVKRPTPVYPSCSGPAHGNYAAPQKSAAHHHAPYGHGPIGGPTPNVQVRNYYYFPPGQPVHIHVHHSAPHPPSIPESIQEQYQAHRHRHHQN